MSDLIEKALNTNLLYLLYKNLGQQNNYRPSNDLGALLHNTTKVSCGNYTRSHKFELGVKLMMFRNADSAQRA